MVSLAIVVVGCSHKTLFLFQIKYIIIWLRNISIINSQWLRIKDEWKSRS